MTSTYGYGSIPVTHLFIYLFFNFGRATYNIYNIIYAHCNHS